MRRRTARRILTVLAVVLVVQYLVVPQLAGVRAAWELLTQVQPGYLVVGALAEVAALAAYAWLLRSLLTAGQRPGFPTVLRIQLATRAASSVVPGGAAAGAGLGFELLRRAGVAGPTAAFALGTQAIGSALVLNAMLWAALVVSIPARGFHPLYGTAAIVGAALLAGFGVIVLLLTRGEERATRVVRRAGEAVPFLDPDGLERVLRRLAGQLQDLLAQPRLVARLAGWAALSWVLHAASLWIFLAAFGPRLPVDGLVVAFGLANIVGAIPITPGGLGIIEGILTPLLVGFGATRGEAILGVIGWRLVNFWLPIPVGAVAYLSLRPRTVPAEEGGPTQALLALTEHSAAEAEELWEWSARHGIVPPRSRRPRPPPPQ